MLSQIRRLDEFIAHWAHATPDACACTLGDDRVSYAELHRRIDQMARALLASGVTRGARIATLSPPNPDFLVCFLASASIGAIWLGLNPRYQIEELTYAMQDSKPLVLLTRTAIEGRNFSAEIRALQATPGLEAVVALNSGAALEGVLSRPEFDQRADLISDAQLAEARASAGGFDPCLIVYTSGSTGRPKGALLHHFGIARFSSALNNLWPVSPAIALNYFPINHVACVCDISMPVLAAGGTIVFMERFEPAASLELMQREGVTFWGSVPSAFQMQIDLPEFQTYDLSSVQLIAWGGSAAPEPLIRRLLSLSPNLATNYGMTETMVTAALPPTSDIEVLMNCVGPAFPGVEFKLLQVDGSEAPQGQPGEVWVRSDYNLAGYWQRPDATAEAMSADGFFKTGDIAVLRPDGNYRISGRIKEMYKSGGYNVYPREIEMALEEHPRVAMAAVVSVPDQRWQEVGIAYILADGDITAAELEQHCRRKLANYKIPKRILIEADLPLLPVGKIDKMALKKRALELY